MKTKKYTSLKGVLTKPTNLCLWVIFLLPIQLFSQAAMPRVGEVTSVWQHPTYSGTVTGDYRIYPRAGVVATNSIQIQRPIVVVEGWDPLDNFIMERQKNENNSYIHIVLS